MLLKLTNVAGGTVLVNSDRIASVRGVSTGSYINIAGQESPVQTTETPDEVYQAYIDQQVEQALDGVSAAADAMKGQLAELFGDDHADSDTRDD